MTHWKRLLLALLAYAAALLPAIADPESAAAPVAVEIASLSFFPHKVLTHADTLTVTLTGTPGGQAAFSIPGVTESQDLREKSPGTYSGSIAIPQDVAVCGAALLAHLSADGVVLPLVEASDRLTIDSTAPSAGNLCPARDSVTCDPRPPLYATVTDSGVGDARRLTRVFADGVDVTSRSQVTERFVFYRPVSELMPGRHRVEIRLTDFAGNESSTSWSFQIAPRTAVGTLTCKPEGVALHTGQTLRWILTAPAGGRAYAEIAGLAAGIDLGEGSPGNYIGEFTVGQGDSATCSPVLAAYTGPNGKTAISLFGPEVSIAAGPPRVPTITSPAEEAGGGDLTVAGRSAPFATLHIEVSYTSRAIGSPVIVEGHWMDAEVIADSLGEWKADGPPFNTGSLCADHQQTDYEVSADVVSDAGASSHPACIHFRATAGD